MSTESQPIRIGLVGLGRAGWGMHCPELAGREEKFQFVAACDVLEDRRARMQEKYQCAVYEDICDLVQDPNVELVDIATRSCDHVAHAGIALEAGKDVFLEKPMCLTYQEALELKEIADKAQGNLYIRHNRRFEPGFQHVMEIIASGILGDVYEVKLRRVDYYRRDDWQTIKQYGGGQLLNWGPHIIDHALHFLASPVQNFWADIRCVAAVGDAEDHVRIILTGENKRVVDLEVSGGAAIGEPEYLIWGTRGALSCTWNKINLRYLDPAKPLSPRTADPGTPDEGFGNPDELPWVEETIEVNPQSGLDWSSIWDALYQTIRHGTPFPITLDEAINVMWVVSQATSTSSILMHRI